MMQERFAAVRLTTGRDGPGRTRRAQRFVSADGSIGFDTCSRRTNRPLPGQGRAAASSATLFTHRRVAIRTAEVAADEPYENVALPPRPSPCTEAKTH